MIILNHFKESSKIIHCVLQKKRMSPILYTERLRAVSKYCETVLHIIQQYINCVGHSGYRSKIILFLQAFSLQTEAKTKYKFLYDFFFQPVKSLMKAKGKLSCKV